MKNIALKTSLLMLLAIAMLSFGCKKHSIFPEPEQLPSPSNSFLPMQKGNMWYNNSQNYTEIQDSVLINDKLFYKFVSLIGGDAYAISYLRIDEQGKLISSDPKYPDYQEIRANFNAKVGDQFFSTGTGVDGDKQVTVTEKTDTKMSFSFDDIYHPNLKGHPYVISYIKGIGFPGNWTKLRINGVQLK